jgi:hypothetical protein
MTTNQPEPSNYDAELDEFLDRAMSGIITKLEAKFDVAAGLADIYARVAELRANAPDSAGEDDRPEPTQSRHDPWESP